MMGFAKNIKMAMIDKGIKVSDLAEKLETDSKVLSVKLSRDNLTGKSVEEIADALNCDVRIVDRQTGKIY